MNDEHIFLNFSKYNWIDEDQKHRDAVVVFSRLTCDLVLIPASVINNGFFSKVFEFRSGQGYFIKSNYLGFQRNKENIVGFKFKIARNEMLRVFLEAYKSSIHDDIELFRLPKTYWRKFRPSPERIEEDIISEILSRLSDSTINQGVGVDIVGR